MSYATPKNGLSCTDAVSKTCCGLFPVRGWHRFMKIPNTSYSSIRPTSQTHNLYWLHLSWSTSRTIHSHPQLLDLKLRNVYLILNWLRLTNYWGCSRGARRQNSKQSLVSIRCSNWETSYCVPWFPVYHDVTKLKSCPSCHQLATRLHRCTSPTTRHAIFGSWISWKKDAHLWSPYLLRWLSHPRHIVIEWVIKKC